MPEYVERERTCKNCVHNDACRNILTKAFSNLTDEEIEQASIGENRCHFFKHTADVAEVRHGKWKSLPFGMHYCSECRDLIGKRRRLPNYCPNCGAKMDGKGEENA